jgi:hypothetical protein
MGIVAGFDKGSLDVLRAKRLWRYLLLSTLLEFPKIDRSACFLFGYVCKK